MITDTTNQTLSGTEEELLAHFKQKYNLIEATGSSTPQPSSILPDNGVTIPQVEPPQPLIRPAAVGNKVTTGFSGLFDGTSWGKN
jgi:hypothetical protein